MSKIGKIKEQLLKEVESLKNKKGLIQAGLPRYNRFFGRDSLITSWQLLDIDSEICKKTLETLARFQGRKIDKKREEEPGKILHETDWKLKWHPKIKGFPFPYYGSVDSTPLFLILFYFYFKKTKNKKFLKKYWKNILVAANWIINYGDKDRDFFLEYQRKNKNGLFHQGWKDSLKDSLRIKPPVAIVEVQGYQYLALKGSAFLAKFSKKNDLAKKLLKRARNLKKSFNEKFWVEDQKYFAEALDGQKKQKKKITSNPGHLLFTGILKKDKERQVVKRLFKKDLWTPYGVRTHSQKEKDFNPLNYHKGTVWPHDNWIIAQGLKKSGYKKEYQKIKKAIFRAFLKLNRLPEHYSVVNNKIIEISSACYPQAWASGALLNLLISKS